MEFALANKVGLCLCLYLYCQGARQGKARPGLVLLLAPPVVQANAAGNSLGVHVNGVKEILVLRIVLKVTTVHRKKDMLRLALSTGIYLRL